LVANIPTQLHVCNRSLDGSLALVMDFSVFSQHPKNQYMVIFELFNS
jgi:hypothetical protein